MRWIRKTLAGSLSMAAIGITAVQAAPGESAFPRFTQMEGKLDSDDLPLSGVKLCVLPDRAPCFEMPPVPLPQSSKELYQFGLNPRSERLPIASGGSWVFFSGMFSGGGSGMLERVASVISCCCASATSCCTYCATGEEPSRNDSRSPTASSDGMRSSSCAPSCAKAVMSDGGVREVGGSIACARYQATGEKVSRKV